LGFEESIKVHEIPEASHESVQFPHDDDINTLVFAEPQQLLQFRSVEVLGTKPVLPQNEPHIIAKEFAVPPAKGDLLWHRLLFGRGRPAVDGRVSAFVLVTVRGYR
jgi:hypothetical protein